MPLVSVIFTFPAGALIVLMVTVLTRPSGVLSSHKACWPFFDDVRVNFPSF